MHQNVCTANYTSRSSCEARVHLGHGNVRIAVLLPEFSNGSHRLLPTVSKFIQSRNRLTNQPTNQASKQLTRQPNKPINQPTGSAKDHIFQRIDRPTNQPTKPNNQSTKPHTNQPTNQKITFLTLLCRFFLKKLIVAFTFNQLPTN